MFSIRTRLYRAYIGKDYGWSMLGSTSIFPVVTRCACCERRLSSSEVVSCAGCCRNAVNRDLVVAIAVCVSGIII